MQLKGLSKYDIQFTDDNRVRVYSLFYRRYISPRCRNGLEKYQLQTDFGKSRHISVGQLRFMKNHPDVSADAISCRTVGIKFREDGSVVDLYRGGVRKRKCTLFTGIDDALNTVLFLMQAADGDDTPILKFAEQARYNAITTVANMLKCSDSTVAIHFDTAVCRFVEQTKDFNVERIMPLFAWLCKVLKCVVKEQRNLKIIFTSDLERFGKDSPKPFRPARIKSNRPML